MFACRFLFAWFWFICLREALQLPPLLLSWGLAVQFMACTEVDHQNPLPGLLL